MPPVSTRRRELAAPCLPGGRDWVADQSYTQSSLAAMSRTNARGVRKHGYCGRFARLWVQAPNFEADSLGVCDGESLRNCRFRAHKRSRQFCRTMRPIAPPTAIPNCAVRISGLPTGQSSAVPRRLRPSGHCVKCRMPELSGFSSWTAFRILASVRSFLCERGSLTTPVSPDAGVSFKDRLSGRPPREIGCSRRLAAHWDHHDPRGMQTRRSLGGSLQKADAGFRVPASAFLLF